MLRIAICDDNPQHRERIHKIAQKAFFSRSDMVVSYFESGLQIVNAIEKKQFAFDLLLLDIHMNNMNGIETAKYIREHGVDVDIIFITVSTEHVYDGYTYKAFAYLLKPVDEQRMIYELRRYLDEKEQTQDYLNVPVKGITKRIPLGKVIYFESNSRKILVHLQNETIAFYAKMDDLEKIIGSTQFIRCHQSYLVNRNFVSAVTRNALRAGEEEIPVSRKYQKKVREIWG